MGGKRNRQAHLSKTANAMQEGQARALDTLADYEDFTSTFLPALQKDLRAHLSMDQILKKYEPVIAARLVQLGVTADGSVALGALKEILDRTQGKAVQKQEHTHKLARLKDEELDAMLASKLAKSGVIETTGHTVEEESEDE